MGFAIPQFVSPVAAQPPSFVNLGIIGPSGQFTFDTEGSGFISELAIWDASGNLLAADQFGGSNFTAAITIDLTEGVYFLGVSEFDSVFEDGFVNSGDAFEPGDSETGVLNINGALGATIPIGEGNGLDETGFFRVEVQDNDISFLFGGDANTPGSSTLTITDPAVTSGSVNVYAAPDFEFDNADLNFFSSDPSVIVITGGEAFNPDLAPIGSRFNSATVTINSATNGNFFLSNWTEEGINPSLASLFDPLFDATNGFLLARIDFEIVGNGTSELSFTLGSLGIFQFPDNDLDPLFGNATITIDVPQVLLGDVNQDGVVDFLDIAPFVAVLSAQSFQIEADLNQDGLVSFFDIQLFIDALGGN